MTTRNFHRSWVLITALLIAGCGATSDPNKTAEDTTPTPAPPQSTPTPEPPADPLVASIAVSNTSGTAPLEVEFTPEVTGGTAPYTYRWVFTDGTEVSDETAMFTFDAEGMYDVELVVTDSSAQEADATTQIAVAAAPMADLVVKKVSATISYFTDGYEPNDDQAYYLGAGPDTFNVIAYLDARDLSYDVKVANLGEADAGTFFVDLFPNVAAPPEPGDESALYTTVDALAAGDTTVVRFTQKNATGGRKSYALLDTTNDVEEALEDNNVSNKLAFNVNADVDWFYFYAEDGNTMDLSLTGLPADYDLVLYAGNTLVDSSRNGGTTDEQISATVTSAGYFTVGVYGYNGAASSDTSYKLTVNVAAP